MVAIPALTRRGAAGRHGSARKHSWPSRDCPLASRSRHSWADYGGAQPRRAYALNGGAGRRGTRMRRSYTTEDECEDESVPSVLREVLNGSEHATDWAVEQLYAELCELAARRRDPPRRADEPLGHRVTSVTDAQRSARARSMLAAARKTIERLLGAGDSPETLT